MKSIYTTLLLLLPLFSNAQHKEVKIHLGTAIFQDVKEGVAVISDLLVRYYGGIHFRVVFEKKPLH
jgi:hypothetical protein